MSSYNAAIVSAIQVSQQSSISQKSKLLSAAAKFLGLSKKDLLSELRQGKSLADVAQEQGKSVDDLKKALLDSVPASQQANLAKNIDKIINARHAKHAKHAKKAGGDNDNDGDDQNSSSTPVPNTQNNTSSSSLTGQNVDVYA